MTIKYIHHIIPIAFIILIYGCIGSPDLPLEPEIEYLSISKLNMNQNSFNTDSILIKFSFTDGDGDLGTADNNKPDITVIDQRTGLEESFNIPEIQSGTTKFAISGEITLKLYTTCCLFPDNIPPCSTPKAHPLDSVIYELFITDEAGNESNHIQTPVVVLNCI